jgi:Amt family ammonium transporter
MNTFLATACAVLSWTFVEWLHKGRPSMLGAASGAVAGLVAITPAAGNVGIPGAFAIGLIAGVVCLWGVTQLKGWLKVDDSLDVFGVHALGGIFGALATGVFNSPKLGGPGFYNNWFEMKQGFDTIGAQLLIQAKAVGVTVVWTAVVAFVAFKLIDWTIGLRVSEDAEREGLDIAEHGEKAYNL